MSLFAAYHSGAPGDRREPVRSTRRQPLSLHWLSPHPNRGACDLRWSAEQPTVSRGRPGSAPRRSHALADDSDLFVGDEERFFAATSRQVSIRLRRSMRVFPDATLVGGATDVGLWVTKQLLDLKRIIWLGRVARLDKIEDSPTGAQSRRDTIARGRRAAACRDPFRSRRNDAPVRARFRSASAAPSAAISPTASRSAICAPALIALGGQVGAAQGRDNPGSCPRGLLSCLRQTGPCAGRVRALGHRSTTWRRPTLWAFKVSKRIDEDISAVMLGARIDVEGRRIVGARIAYGGMAATPKRAAAAEQAGADGR